jgi:LDH2 family malate/lactate/ureidoglycolate dehydrogenase
MPRFDHTELTGFATPVFQATGLSAEDSQRAAGLLVDADLCGHPAHGLSRMEAYCDGVRGGLVNPMPCYGVEQRGSILRIDGDYGLGLCTSHFAMNQAIQLARQQGIAAATVCNSTHFGRAAPYVTQAVEAGMIGIASSNARATVAICGGMRPEVGTNPFGFAAPSGLEHPLVVDMAITAIARGRLRRAAAESADIPPGLALRADGAVARTAAEAMAGILVPFGGQKGSNIALMVEILSGFLSGSSVGREIRSVLQDSSERAGPGHFFLALSVEALLPLEVFERRLAAWLTEVKAGPRAPGTDEILYPGEGSGRRRNANRAGGVEIGAATVASFHRLAERHGLSVPAERPREASA